MTTCEGNITFDHIISRATRTRRCISPMPVVAISSGIHLSYPEKPCNKAGVVVKVHMPQYNGSFTLANASNERADEPGKSMIGHVQIG